MNDNALLIVDDDDDDDDDDDGCINFKFKECSLLIVIY